MSEKELDGTSYTGEISSYAGSGYTQVLPLTGVPWSAGVVLEVLNYLTGGPRSAGVVPEVLDHLTGGP